MADYYDDTYGYDDTTYGDYDTETTSEETMEPAVVNLNAPLYYGWGVYHIWMVVLGVLIMGWYPGLITSNSWWKLQCPSTAWTVVSTGLIANSPTVGTVALDLTGG